MLSTISYLEEILLTYAIDLTAYVQWTATRLANSTQTVDIIIQDPIV